MKLDVARLCLDCEEVHESQHCPSCGSEVFAFLTRWVEPAAELRNDRRRPRPSAQEQPVSAEQLDAYRQLLNGERPRRASLVTKSVLGLAAFSLASWAWRSASRPRPSQNKDQLPDRSPQ